ncbi:MAG: FG-GAP-like repeat-containing protein, partial [bacterium]
NWTVESNQINAAFGWSVSIAGDVNGDGYSDVIVGANLYDNGQTDEGRAYVYQGSATGLSVSPNWTAESDQANANFGNSVSTAGDVNGDGYSDVIAGAYLYDNGQLNEGKTYVYYGNNVTGLRSGVHQYKPGTNKVISSGMSSGSNGRVRMNLYCKSPFGRNKGKIVYDYKDNGTPFNLANSITSSGSGVFTDLGTAGLELYKDESGLNPAKLYKWRTRVQYDMIKYPYQKFGPWKYYNSYSPVPVGNFRAKDGNMPVNQLDLTMFIQGFYNSGFNEMIADTVTVYLRNSSSPYAKVDSSRTYLSSFGEGTLLFLNASSGVNYYLDFRHRNSIQTWSKTPKIFTASNLSFNLSTASTQAFGNNMAQIDFSPFRFGVYSGDVNQDGTVDLSDGSLINNDAFNFVTGYVQSDLTGDDLVDASDAAIVDNNAFNFVSAVTP